MAIIEIKNVTKRFNDKLVLDNISYEINIQGKFLHY